LVMVWFLRLILIFTLLLFSIWLLGKLIIFVWEKIK
jgi:flagellar biogenesis protein FliO